MKKNMVFYGAAQPYQKNPSFIVFSAIIWRSGHIAKGVIMAKVLVVDDAAFMRMMVKDILTKNGYEVAGEAVNGKDALDKYREIKPDLVTMDITMPEVDGITALKNIRAEFPDARVLMCSAMGQQAMVIEAIQAGAKDFIVKPFQADRVIESVKKAIG